MPEQMGWEAADFTRPKVTTVMFPYTAKRVNLIQNLLRETARLAGPLPEHALKLVLENIEQAIAEFRKRD